MDAGLFTKMLSDKSLMDLKKMQYRYSAEAVSAMLFFLKQTMYKSLPLQDFKGAALVYLENAAQLRMSAYKTLFLMHNSADAYGLQAMEEEIHSTLIIENIHSSRQSIRRILNGYAPQDEMENRILGMKKGLDFISDTFNKITEENIFRLYSLTVGDFLEENDRLLPGQFYRHDNVFIVGGKVEHQGLAPEKIPERMAQLVKFSGSDTGMNDLLKAGMIHFYVAYLHPYFDGNGRMARLMHLWYLVQQGYSSALFIPFSSYINKSKNAYYKAYTLIEKNYEISSLIDVTPFLVYLVENVYNRMGENRNQEQSISKYQNALAAGKVTEKEKDLFEFVISAYGGSEFSTKQLEKDFANAAYATIRSFVLKFEDMGILSSQRYGNRVKYRINTM